MPTKPSAGSAIISSTEHRPEGFKWLTLRKIKYRDPTGRERSWESAERTTRKGLVDAVAIIAQVQAPGKPTQVILESQFRPSQGNYVIEFPAGLIDEGETAEQAALRELKEETGYTGRATGTSLICYSDPGMTNTNMQVVTVSVDASSSDNLAVEPQLEDSEFIEVFLLPFKGLYGELQEVQRQKKWDIDARLLIYALGIQQASTSG